MKHCKYITFRIFLCIIYVTTLLFNLSSSRKVIFIKTSIAHCGYHQRGRKGDHMGAVPAHLFVCWLRRQNVEIKREITKMWNKVTFLILYTFAITLLLHHISYKKLYFFKTLFDKTTFFGGQISLEKNWRRHWWMIIIRVVVVVAAKVFPCWSGRKARIGQGWTHHYLQWSVQILVCSSSGLSIDLQKK